MGSICHSIAELSFYLECCGVKIYFKGQQFETAVELEQREANEKKIKGTKTWINECKNLNKWWMRFWKRLLLHRKTALDFRMNSNWVTELAELLLSLKFNGISIH